MDRIVIQSGGDLDQTSGMRGDHRRMMPLLAWPHKRLPRLSRRAGAGISGQNQQTKADAVHDAVAAIRTRMHERLQRAIRWLSRNSERAEQAVLAHPISSSGKASASVQAGITLATGAVK
jgi:hypothetical protein